MKKKELRAEGEAWKKAYHSLFEWHNSSIGALRQELETLQTERYQEVTELKARYESLQSTYVLMMDKWEAEVTELKVRIQELGQANRDLTASLYKALSGWSEETAAQAGQWVPVEDGTYPAGYECYLASFVVADGGASVKAKSGDNGIDLNFDELRICRKVEGEVRDKAHDYGEWAKDALYGSRNLGDLR